MLVATEGAGQVAEYGGGLTRLLDSPFVKAPMNPGYIKWYVPGVKPGE